MHKVIIEYILNSMLPGTITIAVLKMRENIDRSDGLVITEPYKSCQIFCPQNCTALLSETKDSTIRSKHYRDITLSTMASQITGILIVCSTVCSGADQRKHHSSTWLAFVRGSTGDRWIPLTNGLLCRKCFHLLTLCFLHPKLYCLAEWDQRFYNRIKERRVFRYKFMLLMSYWLWYHEIYCLMLG